MTTSSGIAHIREYDKEIQSLEDHLLETAALCRKFAEKVGLGNLGEVAGLIHDIGKNTDLFKNYILSASGILKEGDADFIEYKKLKGKIDHSLLGAKVITERIKIDDVYKAILAQLLAISSLSHHGGLIDCLSPDGINKYQKRLTKEVNLSDYDKLNNSFKDRIEMLLKDSKLYEEIKNTVLYLQRSFKTQELYFALGLIVKYILSCLIDSDRINTADFSYPAYKKIRSYSEYAPWKELSEHLERKVKSFKANNQINLIRQDISNQCKAFSTRPRGLYLLTVPTGGGKTLSSLRFAINHADYHNMDRIIYVIPYTSIIDQNAQVAREIFEQRPVEKDSIVLEHHSNLTPDEESEKNSLLSENWDAPIVFTTMVQFLETIYSDGTKNIRRLHSLANSIIIFDEIQTMPIKCIYMFNTAIKFLTSFSKSTVVLCTATQPLLNELPGSRGQDISLKINSNQNIVEGSRELFKRMKRVEVIPSMKPKGWSTYEVAGLITDEIKGVNSILVIVNTKDSALSLFKQLKSEADYDLFYLSANMCPIHRMDVIEKIKNNIEADRKMVCISTQLIEAGVDVDFQMVIRYLAGLDSIAQAAGRCNRNGKMSKPGIVYVVNPENENLSKLQDIRIGRDIARRVLDEFKLNPERYCNDILSKELMDLYYRYYFYEQGGKMSYPQKSGDSLYDLLSTNRNAVEEYKRINSKSLTPMFFIQSFKSAAKAFSVIDDKTRGVIVPYREGKQLIEELCALRDLSQINDLLRQAQRYSVNLFENQINNLNNLGAINETQKGLGILYLQDDFYSEECGLSEGQMETLMY